MRPSTATVVGGFAVLLGGVWFIQGIGLMRGSFMTGSRLWLFIGLVVALGGFAVLGNAVRAHRNGTRD
jgi:fatty acid desaturase